MVSNRSLKVTVHKAAKPKRKASSKKAAAKIIAEPLPEPKRPWHHRVIDTIKTIFDGAD